MKLKIILLVMSCCFFVNTFALDQAVKEETNPPAAEGAIVPDQIPPLLTGNSGNTVTTN